MKKNKDEYKLKLTGNYLNQYEAIEQYIECSDSMYNKKEECLEEILDLLLTAQENERLPEEVIGKDIKTFCDNVLKGINYHSSIFYIAVRFTAISFTALIVGIIFMALYNVFGGQGTVVVRNQVSIIFTYGIALTTGLFDFLIDFYFRKQIAKNGKNKYIKFKGEIRLALVVLCSMLFSLIEETFVKKYTTLPRMLLIVVITLLLVAVVDCIERRGGFDGLNGSSYRKSKDRELLKTALYLKYEKKSNRNIRKNKVYSVEYFAKKQKKEIEIGHVMQCILFPFIMAEVFLCGYSILAKELTSGIFILFILILGLMVINIKLILIKKTQLKLLQEFCEERIDKENRNNGE